MAFSKKRWAESASWIARAPPRGGPPAQRAGASAASRAAGTVRHEKSTAVTVPSSVGQFREAGKGGVDSGIPGCYIRIAGPTMNFLPQAWALR
jgi:hypothetical protein